MLLFLSQGSIATIGTFLLLATTSWTMDSTVSILLAFSCLPTGGSIHTSWALARMPAQSCVDFISAENLKTIVRGKSLHSTADLNVLSDTTIRFVSENLKGMPALEVPSFLHGRGCALGVWPPSSSESERGCTLKKGGLGLAKACISVVRSRASCAP